ncbi:MAG: hypothetical protein IT440_01475 [Phycisphaeraceae bacterium]|nr:hypothetical protein [Phycisphaeraceae bacterium]
MEGVLLTHAWPSFCDRSALSRLFDGPVSRSAYIFAFRSNDVSVGPGPIPDYTPTGDMLCAYMALLYGKRFDHHGLVEGSGLYHVPNMAEYANLYQHSLPHNSNTPRADYAVPLSLVEMKRLRPLFDGTAVDQRILHTFQTCAKFYLQALQNAERNPEVSYLHLITAGEILSNYYEYDKNELLDEESLRILEVVRRDVDDGQKIAKQIIGKMLQIKKRFLITISNLIDESFFSRTEAPNMRFGFLGDSFMKRMASAYDLRSKYVHTGIPFGSYVSLTLGKYNNEVQAGAPVVDEDKELEKLIGHAPTLIGLERVIRYVLLKYAEMHGVYIGLEVS